MSTSGGTRSLSVAGHLREAPSLAAVPEPFIVVDIGRAQDLLGISGLVDRIDVMLEPGHDAEYLAKQIREKLDNAFDVIAPVGRGEYFENAVNAYQRTIEGFSLLALLEAIFGTHGDAPKIVMAASTIEDCFYSMITARKIAETFNTVEIVLSDATLDGFFVLRSDGVPVR